MGRHAHSPGMGATSSQLEEANAKKPSRSSNTSQDLQDADIAKALVRMQHEDSQLRRNSYTAETNWPSERPPYYNHSQASVSGKKKKRKKKRRSGHDRSSSSAIVPSSEGCPEDSQAVTERGEAEWDSLMVSASAKRSDGPKLNELATFLELRSQEYQPTPTKHPLDEVSDDENLDQAYDGLHTTSDYSNNGSPKQNVRNSARVNESKGKLVEKFGHSSSSKNSTNGNYEGNKSKKKSPRSSENGNIFEKAKFGARIREEQLREEHLKLATEGSGSKGTMNGNSSSKHRHNVEEVGPALGGGEAHTSIGFSGNHSGDTNVAEEEDEDLFVHRRHTIQNDSDENEDIHVQPRAPSGHTTEDEDEEVRRAHTARSGTKKPSKQVATPTTTLQPKKRRLPVFTSDVTPKKKARISGTGRSRTDTASGGNRIVGVFRASETRQLDTFKKDYCAEHGITGRAFNAKVQTNARNRPDMAQFWNEVGDAVPDRDRQAVQKAARRMWHNFERGPWTAGEDEELAAYYEELGPQWRKIADQMDRMAGDVRDRYRNHVKGMENRKKDRWAEDEVHELKIAIGDCLATHLAIEDAEIKVGDLPSTPSEDMEKLLNWAVVSDRMGETRSRMQCLYKWKKLKERGLNLAVEARKGWNRLLRSEGIDIEENEGVNVEDEVQPRKRKKSTKGSKSIKAEGKNTQKHKKRLSAAVVEDATEDDDYDEEVEKMGDASEQDAAREGPFIDDKVNVQSDEEASDGEDPTENGVDDIDEANEKRDENEESEGEGDSRISPRSDDTSEDENEKDKLS